MINNIKQNGFTVTEVLIAVSVVALLVGTLSGMFSSFLKPKNLDKDYTIIRSILSEARSSALSSKGASNYGVRIESSQVVLFKGDTYNVSDSNNVIHALSPVVQVSNISLAGGSVSVVFDRLTGETNQFGTITLSLIDDPTKTKIIKIYATGLVD